MKVQPSTVRCPFLCDTIWELDSNVSLLWMVSEKETVDNNMSVLSSKASALAGIKEERRNVFDCFLVEYLGLWVYAKVQHYEL